MKKLGDYEPAPVAMPLNFYNLFHLLIVAGHTDGLTEWHQRIRPPSRLSRVTTCFSVSFDDTVLILVLLLYYILFHKCHMSSKCLCHINQYPIFELAHRHNHNV